MTIGSSATRGTGTGSTSVSPTMPGTPVTGDAVLVYVNTKPDTATINVPAGWTLVADVAGGGGTTGIGVGPSRQAVLFREKDASWSAIPTITITGGNSTYVLTVRFTKDAAAAWEIAAATTTWGSAGATTSGAATLGSNPGITAGDAVAVNHTHMDDTISTSAQSVAATGISAWGAVANPFASGTGTNDDIGTAFFWVPVTTGTASAAPSVATTFNIAGRGTVSLIRLREVTTSPITITGGQAAETDTALAGAALVEIRRNRSTNPSFETDVSGWAAQSGASAPAQSTTRAWVDAGAASMLLARGAGSSTLWAARDLGPAQVLPSTTHTISAYLWAPSTNADDVSLRVAGADVVAAAETATTVRDAWVRVSVTFTTNATADAVFAYVRGGTTGQVWVDGVMLNTGTTANDYFAGDTAASPPFSYRWTGTAQLSQSVQMAPYVAPSTLSGGQAGETDTALAGTTATGVTLAGGQALETDTALAGAITEAHIIPGGQASETDAARAGSVTVVTVITGGLAEEIDEAFAGTFLDVAAIIGGQATELDAALPGAIVFGYGATDATNRVGGRRRGGYAVATWEPPVAEAPATIVLGEAHDRANAFGAVTMNGTQAVYDVTTVTKQRHRDRIVVGGKDITYWRGVRTPLPTYQLVSPLLYGPATMRLPQVAAAFEQVGTGDLSWLQVGKPVKVQRVDPETGAVAATDHKGLVIAFNASGRDLTVEIGGEASGRAALMEKQIPIFRSTHDIGQIAAFAMMPLKVPFTPHRGPTTGIKLARFGGTGWLDYISQLCARAWTRTGAQWTIMPGTDGAYRMTRKDTTTVDATAYIDDARTVADLRRDSAEEPNRIFVTGITPEGQRVLFAVFPGLLKTHPAPYPFHDGRTFGAGTTDADTATGDGITIMVKRLNMFGIIDVEDAPGGFDADVTKAIRDLQEDAELPVTGDINPATWRRLYDLDATGYTLRASAIEPAAQRSYTKPWLRSPSGALVARNPNYDPRRPWVDRVVDLGSGFTKSQMREFARAELDHPEDNWLGTITFHTGGLVSGSHGHSFTPTGDDVFRARRLKPGMNIRLPHSPGGDITVHVSAVLVDEDGKVTTTVDTRARDSMAVWEVIERNRESRRDPARQWIRDHRASGQIKDAIDGWWAPGGKLGNPITVPAHTWTVVELIAGQEGTVQALRVRTNPNAEYVMAVFGKHVHPKRLSRLIGNPLTKRGAKQWADEGVRNQLDRDRFLLYVAGDDEQPLGYYPRTKRPDTVITDETNPDYDPTADPDSVGTDDQPTIEVETETGSITPLTGRWEDAAGFSYRTFAQPVIYVAVYADRDTVIPAGRVMWPQLEAGA